MKIKIYIIDSFTSEPFKGNPAGVCLLEQELPVNTMQAIATELNLSETAFIKQHATDDTKFSIRYFTPTVEINFCGHATLAAAKLILHRLKKEQVIFTTHHQLVITAISEGETIKMEFPLYDTVEYMPNKKLYDAFGIKEPISSRFSKELNMLVIELKDEKTLSNIQPNYINALQSTTELKGLTLTCIATNSTVYDFYSRSFWPWVGINEDPVTGAAHAVLAKYWGNKLHKTEMQAYQLSKRGGAMKLKIKNDRQLEVISNATIVIEGIMEI
jgi:PhzF family phenazine biosynthesis protein